MSRKSAPKPEDKDAARRARLERKARERGWPPVAQEGGAYVVDAQGRLAAEPAAAETPVKEA